MTKQKITLVIIVILVVLFAGFLAFSPSKPSPYNEFAQCLKDKGALFYGAFWCPHCRDQKDLFKGSASKLPYVECSTPDGKGQLSICAEKEIKSYPTWTFADGEIVPSLMTLEQLSTKTSCPITPGTQTATTTQI